MRNESRITPGGIRAAVFPTLCTIIQRIVIFSDYQSTYAPAQAVTAATPGQAPLVFRLPLASGARAKSAAARLETIASPNGSQPN